MADFGQEVAGTGVNMLADRAVQAAAGSNPWIPIPSFYNQNSPNHFGDSQMMQMMHGNPRAWAGYGRRAAGNAIDMGLMGTPVGLPNMIVRGITGLFGHPYSIGGLISNIGNNNNQPTGTVGGQPADVTSTSATSGDVSIDPWSGNSLSGGGSPWMQPDAFSSYGPYASGYQAPGQAPQSGPAALPDFSHYSDQFMQDADQNGDGRLNPGERRDAMSSGYGPSGNVVPAMYGVSNFMANGQNVINGVRPAGGDMNGLAVYNPRLNGG